jgi:hypothetical protein
MTRRVAQPPMDRLTRSREEHAFWPGALVAVLGLCLGYVGWNRVTGVETLEGGVATEAQVNRAFAHGGVRPVQVQVVPPPGFQPPPWAQPGLPPATVYARGADGRLLYRIDGGAVDPCPT